MNKKCISVVFDRKKRVPEKGVGNVELLIYFSRTQKKYLVIKQCTESEWKMYQNSKSLANEISVYNSIIAAMQYDGDEMTISNFNARLGIDNSSKEQVSKSKLISSPTSFLDFFLREMNLEHISAGTRRRKDVVYRSLQEWGMMNRFPQVNESSVRAFDTWLHKSGERTAVTIHNYHKTLKIYTRAAYEQGFIKSNPYESSSCRFERGRSKERNPLTEEELLRVRNLNGLGPKLDRARDIFVFCAYTGLSYVDSQSFDFFSMAEKHDDMYFIDGKRCKTGSCFFTPILPPALDVLMKYKFQLPQISNQKLNDYLHLIERLAGLRKPMTTHIARHSFATLVLSYDIPIENLARMLGHTNIKTTQIYAKILKTTIERHSRNLCDLIK